MFRSKAFLADHFGNAQGVLAFLRAYNGPTPTDAAVLKWFQRGSVPGDWLTVLLCYLELDRGSPVSLVAYLEGRTSRA